MITWIILKKNYPEIILPKNGKIEGRLKGDIFIGNWVTDVNNSGEFAIRASEANKESIYPSTVMTWGEFKREIADNKYRGNKYIFRGQPGSWRLRTSYHRKNRCNLFRYVQENIPELHRYISGHLNYMFRLDDPNDYTSLMHLAQHHTYPTPLLDWTYSSYVATYFAFDKLSEAAEQNTVRIFIFDKESWLKDISPSAPHLASTKLTISLLNAPFFYNNRALVQQSITLFSNVDDIESFIQHYESKNNKNYLSIVELPVETKEEVMEDLRKMNITISSLFPGLDSTCKMLSDMHFK